MLETSSGDFHGAGDFFGGIFMVLETTSGIFTRAGDFFGGIFRVLETYLWVFSRYWGLFWKDFYGAGDFWDFNRAGDFLTALETASGIFTVLDTSLEGF